MAGLCPTLVLMSDHLTEWDKQNSDVAHAKLQQLLRLVGRPAVGDSFHHETSLADKALRLETTRLV